MFRSPTHLTTQRTAIPPWMTSVVMNTRPPAPNTTTCHRDAPAPPVPPSTTSSAFGNLTCEPNTATHMQLSQGLRSGNVSAGITSPLPQPTLPANETYIDKLREHKKLWSRPTSTINGTSFSSPASPTPCLLPQVSRSAPTSTSSDCTKPAPPQSQVTRTTHLHRKKLSSSWLTKVLSRPDSVPSLPILLLPLLLQLLVLRLSLPLPCPTPLLPIPLAQSFHHPATIWTSVLSTAGVTSQSPTPRR